jgi:hypothetical protein
MGQQRQVPDSIVQWWSIQRFSVTAFGPWRSLFLQAKTLLFIAIETIPTTVSRNG